MCELALAKMHVTRNGVLGGKQVEVEEDEGRSEEAAEENSGKDRAGSARTPSRGFARAFKLARGPDG